MHRTALTLAAFLTAFVLIMTGGLVALRSVAQPAEAAAPAAADAREAEWRQLLAQANERLQQANDALAQAQAAPAQNPAAGSAAGSSANGADIGALRAAQAALLAVPGARLLRPPELVNFQGTTAYEVVLDQGAVYVDAATSQILYNGADAAQWTTRRGEHEDHDGNDDHGEHGDDDDHGEHEDHDD
jgi:hypothetical protein